MGTRYAEISGAIFKKQGNLIALWYQEPKQRGALRYGVPE